MNEYITVQGDTWDIIAKKVYGNEKLMIHMLRINPEWNQTVFFPSGVILEVPELEADDTPVELPPWKQVTPDAG